MLNSGQAGFTNAPVTKGMIMVVVITTLFGSILSSQKRLTLTDLAFDRAQLWRLLTHNFVFSTPGELLFGLTLLYYFRQFERHMGSSRYFALAFFATFLHTFALCLLHLLLPSRWTPPPSPGPYALVYACIVRFAFDTPRIYAFRLMGAVALSDKSFPYLLSLQLALSSPARSIIPVLTAILAGLVARFPPIAASLDTPSSLVRAASVTILPLLDTAPAARPSRRIHARGAANASQSTHPSSNGASQASLTGAHIDTLVAMGFSRERSIAALVRASDDVHLATERLLAEGTN